MAGEKQRLWIPEERLGFVEGQVTQKHSDGAVEVKYQREDGNWEEVKK